ncbi:MAG: lysophospholipid acyltransferase family protein [Ferruginibacter sp.]
MRYFLRLIQIIYSTYAILVFLLLMLILFPFVLLTSFFGETMRGNLIYYIATFWADAGMLLWGIPHKTISDKEYNPDHPVIFVFNHISYLDIPVLMKTLRDYRIRILGKIEMSKIPIFGFTYRAAVVMVDRSDADARAKSVKKLKAVLKKNISVVIAPEGTFNMTNKPLKEFYDGAFKIAIETQTPIKPVIFLDTYDRLHYKSIFSFTPGRSRSVFLEEVSVKGYDTNDVEIVKQKVYDIMEAALIKYKASWIRE